MANPTTSIFLCSVPFLDETYEHTINFENITQQQNYFNGKVTRSFENCYYNRKEYTINLPVHVDEIQHNNYLFYRNNIDMKTYFCFIIESEYVSENNCKIYFDIDVLQTYMFDYTLSECFIEKCHSQRWKNVNGFRVPYHNTNEEGLDYGLVVQHDVIPLLNYTDNYIICSSVPIGKLDSSGGDTGGGGDWQVGKVSSGLFRYVKGWEGYAPYLYSDSGGVETIGYGITRSELGVFNALVSSQPVGEELASQQAYNVINKSYGSPIVDAVKALGCNSQQQFDALCDLAYNAGVGRVTGSNSLTDVIKKDPNDRVAISNVWKTFIIKDAQGNILEGLKKRRQDEINMYFDGNYTPREISIIGKNGSPTGEVVTDNNGNGWLPS